MLKNGGLRCFQVEDQVRMGSDGERWGVMGSGGE